MRSTAKLQPAEDEGQKGARERIFPAALKQRAPFPGVGNRPDVPGAARARSLRGLGFPAIVFRSFSQVLARACGCKREEGKPMDVRCERCRTEYEFDDEKITEAGVTVRCTVCGHVFRVRRTALVVTVPLKPGEAPAAPDLPPSNPEKPREWRVRQANGNVFTFKELTTLQKWIVERKVAREDEISLTCQSWKRLGDIAELASFFQVVEAADRANALAALAQAPALAPQSSAPQAVPSAPAPAPAQEPLQQIEPAGAPRPPAPLAESAAWEADKPSVAPVAAREPAWSSQTDDLDPAELAAIKGSGKGKLVIVMLLLVGVGVGGFLYAKSSGLIGGAEQASPSGASRDEGGTPPSAPSAATETSPTGQAGEPAAAVTPQPTPLDAGPAQDAGETAQAKAEERAPDAPAAGEAKSHSEASQPAKQAVAAQEAQPAKAKGGSPDAPAAGEAKSGPEASQPVKEAVAAQKEPEAKPAKAEGGIPDGKSFYWYIERAHQQRERGRVDSALAYYEKAEQLEPGNFEVFTGKGFCLFDKGRYDEAIALFQQALGKNPRFLDAILGLAESHKEKGNKAKAIEYYEKYLDEAPSGTSEANLARSAIERLKKE
jgi:predicted Zn finger-like uncharacterized protein